MGAGLSGLTGSDRTHLTIGIGSLALFWLIYRTTRNNGGGDESILLRPTQIEPFQNRSLDIRNHADIPSLPEIVPEGRSVRQSPTRFKHIHFNEDERPAPWLPNANRKSLSDNSRSTTDISNPNANNNTKIQLMRETTFDGLSEDGSLGTRMVCHHHFETPVVATEQKRSVGCQTKGFVRNRERIAETLQDPVRSKISVNNNRTDSSSTIRSNKFTNNGQKDKNNDDSREKDMQDAVNGPTILNDSQIRSKEEEKVLTNVIFSKNTLFPLILSNTRVETTPVQNNMPTYSNDFSFDHEINHVPSTLPIIASFCQIPPPPPPVVNSPPKKKNMRSIIPKTKVDVCYHDEDNMSLFSNNSIGESLPYLKETPPLSAVASKKVSYLSTTDRDSRDSDLEKGTSYTASKHLLQKPKHKLKYPTSSDISSHSEKTVLNVASTVPSVEEHYGYNLRKTITSIYSALSAPYSTAQLSTSNFELEVKSIASTTRNESTDYSREGVFAVPSQLPIIESSAGIQPPPPSIRSALGRLHSDSRTKSLRGNLSTLALALSPSRKKLNDESSKSQKKNEPTNKETPTSLNSLTKVRRPSPELSSESEEEYIYSLHGNTHTDTVSHTPPITDSNITVQMSAHYVPSADMSTLFDDVDECYEELRVPIFNHGSERKSFANDQTTPSTSTSRTLPEVHFDPSTRNGAMKNEIRSLASIQYSNKEQISFPLDTLSSSSRTFPDVAYESKDRYTHFQDSISPSSTFPTKESSSIIKQSSLVTSIYDDGSSYEELSVISNSSRRHMIDENTLVSSTMTTNILPNVPYKSKQHDRVHSIHNNDSSIESIGSLLLNSSVESLKSIKTSLPDVSSLGKYNNESEQVGSSIIPSIYSRRESNRSDLLSSQLLNSLAVETEEESQPTAQSLSSTIDTLMLPDTSLKTKSKQSTEYVKNEISNIISKEPRTESLEIVVPSPPLFSLTSSKSMLPNEFSKNSRIYKDERLQAGISSVSTNHSRTDQVVTLSPSQSTSFSFHSARSLPSVSIDSTNDDELVLKAIPSVLIMNHVKTEYQLQPSLVGSVTSINTSSKYDETYSSLDEEYVAYIPSRDLMEKSQIQKRTKHVKIPLKTQTSHTQYSDSLFSETSSNNSLKDPVMTLTSQKPVPSTSAEKSIAPDQHEYSDYEGPFGMDGHSKPILKRSLTENVSLTNAKASITFEMDNYSSNIEISPEDEVIMEPSTITLCQKSETCLSKLKEEVQLRKEKNNTGVSATPSLYFQDRINSYITVKKSSTKLETDMDILNYDMMSEIEATEMIKGKILRKEVSRGLNQPRKFTDSRPKSSKRDPRDKIFAPVHSKKVTPLTKRSVEEVTTEHNRNKPRKIIIESDSDQPSTSKKKKWTK